MAIGLDGTLWMLVGQQGQKSGDVLVFDALRKRVARAQLPSGADPLIVDSLAGSVVVADFWLGMSTG